jgi:cobalt/nickel transport system ATP-binding protein
MSDIVLDVHELYYRYAGGIDALCGVSFSINKGERVGILGPNGAGKSTLILLLAALLKPTSGSIKIFDEDTTSNKINLVRKRVGIVFQDPEDQLFNVSVIEDVRYGPKNLGFSADEIQKNTLEALEAVNALHLKDRPPHRLSFGEKKRVAIATALAHKPDLLILDEPTANLDPASRASLVNLLKKLSAQGMTLVVSTHDIEALPDLVDRVIIVFKGKSVADGPIEELLTDASLLESSSLTTPTMAKLMTELKTLGFINNVPLTYEEGLKVILKLLSK